MNIKQYKPITYLFPIFIFTLFELYTHNPFTTMKPGIIALNFVFFEILTVFLIFLVGRVHIAIYIETVLFAVIGLANYYVIDFRSAPIMPWDIFSIRTAASVANNYQYTIKKETIFVLMGFILLLIVEYLYYKGIKPCFKRSTRIATVLISFFLLYGFTAMLHQDAVVAKLRLYDKLFTPTVMSKRDGTAVAFLMELKYVTVEKPNKYSKKAASELLASFDNEADHVEPADRPNIIVIMNEAFSDPGILGEFETNKDYMPFVHSILNGSVKHTISGNLNVSVLGGNTANTEFEFLTGDSLAFLPQGSVAYQQYVKNNMPTLVSHLDQLGYDTIAMHPYHATGWNRNTVYPMFGFERSLFIHDWKKPEKIRKYVSDQACYDKIISLYEEKKADEPLFVFNVTMQNHSSYSEDFDNFTPDISLEKISGKSLANYLSLLQISDIAIQNLIQYFEEQEEHTMIVFFGDHQPTNSVINPIWKANGLSADTLSDEEEALRYKVPFFIWANYDIGQETNVETSANFLGTRILKAAQLPSNPYFSFLDQLQQTYPVVTSIQALDTNGSHHLIKDVKNQLLPYAQLQYYHLFGNK